MRNQRVDNKYNYVEINGSYERVSKTDEMSIGVKSVQESLLLKLESDFNKHRECIDFIDNLRK